MADGFVPSYNNEEERLEEIEKNKKSYRMRIIILSIVAVIVVATVIVTSYILANRNYSKYEKYEDKMDLYGFSQVYENGRCNTRDKVTKSEAVKMLLACLYNVPSIDGIALPTEETYPNAIWVEYAVKQGFVTHEEVNASNADDKVKYQEVLVWMYNIKAKALNIEPDTADNYTVKDINAYNPDQQLAIKDMLNSGIITVNTSKIKGGQKLYKGKLNELIINFAEKYNTITVGDAKININEEKIPTNANRYTYTLANVNKEIYELPFINDGGEGFISPVEYYPNNKQYFTQIKTYVEGYYDYLLSVDNATISTAQMKRKLKKYAYEQFDDQKLEQYVNYVKANNIKLTGKSTAQMPCVYFDGKDYRVRVKLDINVESSNTKENLLFGDSNMTYNDTQATIYIDAILAKNDTSETLFVVETPISKLIVKNSSSVLSKEV